MVGLGSTVSMHSVSLYCSQCSVFAAPFSFAWHLQHLCNGYFQSMDFVGHQIGQLGWKFEVPADFDRLLQETAKRRVLRFCGGSDVKKGQLQNSEDNSQPTLAAESLHSDCCHLLIVELLCQNGPLVPFLILPFLTCLMYKSGYFKPLHKSNDSCDLSGPTRRAGCFALASVRGERLRSEALGFGFKIHKDVLVLH